MKNEYHTELVVRAKAGDSNAFASLFESVYKDLYRFSLYTLKNSHDAEDVVSETVADAYESLKKLKNVEAFKAWIFKILSIKCKRKLKQYANRNDELKDDLSVELNDYDSNYDVRAAFAKLSDQERLILSMHIFGGYNSKEIGSLLHINANTIRSKHSRALQKMEQILTD